MQSICNYIQNNRDSLDVSPDWIKERDCIYDQFIRASQSAYWKMPDAPPFTVSKLPLPPFIIIWIVLMCINLLQAMFWSIGPHWIMPLATC